MGQRLEKRLTNRRPTNMFHAKYGKIRSANFEALPNR